MKRSRFSEEQIIGMLKEHQTQRGPKPQRIIRMNALTIIFEIRGRSLVHQKIFQFQLN